MNFQAAFVWTVFFTNNHAEATQKKCKLLACCCGRPHTGILLTILRSDKSQIGLLRSCGRIPQIIQTAQLTWIQPQKSCGCQAVPPDQGTSEPFGPWWHITSRLREGRGAENKQVPTQGGQQITAAGRGSAEKMRCICPLPTGGKCPRSHPRAWGLHASRQSSRAASRTEHPCAYCVAQQRFPCSRENSCLWVCAERRARGPCCRSPKTAGRSLAKEAAPQEA